MTPANLETVFSYHERTKHHLDRYARSPGFMDWDNQPDPFRRYEGAPVRRLALPSEAPAPTYDSLYAVLPPAEAVTVDALSRLFYYSLALSAWKQVRGPDGTVRSRWALRVNPSSGNLHPTEGYLICGPAQGLHHRPAVWHYAPREHALELRRELDALAGVPADTVLLGLTSIHWREAWKYGERAWRYCQHDCGHAIGAVTLAAACLGWRARLLDGVSTALAARILGVDSQTGPEAECADCLLALSPAGSGGEVDFQALAAAPGSPWFGAPNPLSPNHRPWPVIEEVAAASRSAGFAEPPQEPAGGPAPLPDRGLSAHRIIRQRRSAVAMDGRTSIDSGAFYRILSRAMPQETPYGVLPWRPAVSHALFVHRVEGIEPGLYALARHPSHEAILRRSFQSGFLWEKPAGCPAELPLYLLVPARVTAAARTVSCHQEIAADGAFALGMLAEFDARLRERGPAMYPRLFWETGVVGQVLYLEAEAAGIRATGIGCFFDDVMHEMLGIADRSWQSLYHFTAGGPLDDERLETGEAYAR